MAAVRILRAGSMCLLTGVIGVVGVFGLAACGRGSGSTPGSSQSTGSATPSAAPSTAPFIPPVTPSVTRPPSPGMRSLTESEKTYKTNCEQGRIKSGCEFFTDDALRLQGIDPRE
ncbi:hypothetical protein GCM10023321_31090 [Pseudonocardia eucalypti]|uniref:Lipoprotein n=1 Tax=Pseudonocardia eucalypti TaxID=648755 RepID=A0ABP9Q4F6_9PSEU